MHHLKKSMKADGKSRRPAATPKRVGPVDAQRVLKELRQLEGYLQDREEAENCWLQSDVELDYFSGDSSF